LRDEEKFFETENTRRLDKLKFCLFRISKNELFELEYEIPFEYLMIDNFYEYQMEICYLIIIHFLIMNDTEEENKFELNTQGLSQALRAKDVKWISNKEEVEFSTIPHFL
jgi:hypothetical protein